MSNIEEHRIPNVVFANKRSIDDLQKYNKTAEEHIAARFATGVLVERRNPALYAAK